jgi:hypothetical protein
MWIGFVWFVTELAGSYEHGNELWGSMKGGKSCLLAECLSAS